jgi:CheY-like chemotaxis protein
VFFACTIGEALVANGYLELLYLGDRGFLAMVLTLMVETLRRVMRDARALELLGQDLAQQVSRRTLERDEAREALAVAATARGAGPIGSRGHGEPVDWVLCDVMMPGGSGQERLRCRGRASA